MIRNNSFKNFSFIGLGRITSLILQAIFYLLFAALLEPEVYGKLNVIIALAGTFSLVSIFGFHNTLTVFIAKNKSNLSEQVKTLALVTSSLAAVILLFIEQYAALLSLGLSFFILSQHQQLGLKQYKQFMGFSVLKGILILALPILLFLVLEIPGIVLGMAIANFVSSIPYFRELKIKSFFGLKNHYKLLIHNFGIDASSNLPRLIDKLLIAPLFGFWIVGVYQLNLQILFGLEVLPVILYTYLLSEESSGKQNKKLSIIVVLISIVVALVAIVVSPFFIEKFFPKYVEGITSLQILVISIIPLTITSIYSAKLQANESIKIGYSAIVRIGTLLILIFILGSIYELEGLSLAVLFSIIINTIFLYYLYTHQTSKKMAKN